MSQLALRAGAIVTAAIRQIYEKKNMKKNWFWKKFFQNQFFFKINYFKIILKVSPTGILYWKCAYGMDFWELIKKNTAAISGTTDILVAGPGAGGKIEEARSRGVEIWDEEQFQEALDRAPVGGCA